MTDERKRAVEEARGKTSEEVVEWAFHRTTDDTFLKAVAALEFQRRATVAAQETAVAAQETAKSTRERPLATCSVRVRYNRCCCGHCPSDAVLVLVVSLSFDAAMTTPLNASQGQPKGASRARQSAEVTEQHCRARGPSQ